MDSQQLSGAHIDVIDDTLGPVHNSESIADHRDGKLVDGLNFILFIDC